MRLIEILQPLNLTLEQLSLDERGQMEALLAGGARLVLGYEDFLVRMHRFVAIYRKELAPRMKDITRVDLRYETGLAVAYRDQSHVAKL